jgi:hypothetical protein
MAGPARARSSVPRAGRGPRDGRQRLGAGAGATAAHHHVNERRHHREYQEDVDEPAEDVEPESEHPHDEENSSGRRQRVQHFDNISTLGEMHERCRLARGVQQPIP